MGSIRLFLKLRLRHTWLAFALCAFFAASAPAEDAHAAQQAKATPKKAVSATVATVYDKQPLVTDAELARFLKILPQFRRWTSENKENAGPVARKGRADFLYSARAADWVITKGWKPERFFCVMGRMAAAIFILEEGNDMSGEHPPDMPEVAEEELNLTRRHLEAILKALDKTGDKVPAMDQ
ncbi:MAG: serine/threonine protein phosphatase [Desulfovibrio sp.]|jgi:hypothetical protein|nr:serine/threonine protein phosphatase [Desulfovibrio sp.]